MGITESTRQYQRLIKRGISVPTESRQYDPHEHFKTRDIPNPLDLVQGVEVIPKYGLGLLFCSVGNLMISSALEGRELLLREAWEIVGGCVLPFIGRAMLHRVFYERYDWELMALEYERYTYEVQMKMPMH